MTQSPEDVFRQIEDLLKAGKLHQARLILAEQLKVNPNSTRAWWLMSQALTDQNRQVDCLQRLLRLDPGDERAKERLAELNKPQELLPSISPFSTSVAPVEMKSADEIPALPAWAAHSEAPIQPPAEEMEDEISPPVSETQASPRSKRLLVGGLFLLVILVILIISGLLMLSNRRRLAESQLHIEQETLAMAQALTNMPLPTLIPTWTASPSRTLLPTATTTTIPTHTPTLRYPPTKTPIPADLVGPGSGSFCPGLLASKFRIRGERGTQPIC